MNTNNENQFDINQVMIGARSNYQSKNLDIFGYAQYQARDYLSGNYGTGSATYSILSTMSDGVTLTGAALSVAQWQSNTSGIYGPMLDTATPWTNVLGFTLSVGSDIALLNKYVNDLGSNVNPELSNTIYRTGLDQANRIEWGMSGAIAGVFFGMLALPLLVTLPIVGTGALILAGTGLIAGAALGASLGYISGKKAYDLVSQEHQEFLDGKRDPFYFSNKTPEFLKEDFKND